MADRTFNVLFLCTGNSARSIMAEALLNRSGQGRFRAFSAGSHPAGRVNPLVAEFLRLQHLPVEGARSKSWDEFAVPGAPMLHCVITVCDEAAGEACPVWPGQPVTAHWSVPDPARFMEQPEQARKVIREAFDTLQRRVQLLVALPVESLDRLALQGALREIGRAR
ncbi:MAG TPA: arsenate reductase ArsC [Burkholderiales bacterium]|nr:arsenate reductase ArsC [Burkholderiales bacterium]